MATTATENSKQKLTEIIKKSQHRQEVKPAVNYEIESFFRSLADRGEINYRQEQVYLTCDIHRAFVESRVFIGESPTGTGKTLGYMAAAARYCVENPQGQVVIAVPTIQLQSQAIKDYEKFLASEYHLNTAILKGKTNYIDRTIIKEVMRSAESDEERRAIAELIKEADRVNGDIDLIDESVIDRFEDITGTTVSTLLVHQHETDSEALHYVNKAMEKAMRANIVIINHALFVAYAFFKMNKDNRNYLEESRKNEQIERIAAQVEGIPIGFDNCVVDEAHRIASTVKHMLSRSVPVRSVLSLAGRAIKSVKNPSSSTATRIRHLKNLCRRIYEISEETLKESENYEGDTIPIKWYEDDDFSKKVVKMVDLMNDLLKQIGNNKVLSNGLGKRIYYVRQYQRHCDEILKVINTHPDSKKEYRERGFYIRAWEDRKSVSIVAIPATVAAPIRYMSSHFRSICFISGTLADEAGSFNRFILSAGLKYLVDKKEMIIRRYAGISMKNRVKLHLYPSNPAPFNNGNGNGNDYKKTYTEQFVPAVKSTVLNTVKNAKKRTLLLCGSIWEAKLWQGIMEDEGIENFFYSASMGHFNEIKERFEKTRRSVLISASVWEGVDVEISDLVILRVPYSQKNDPCIMAQRDYMVMLYDGDEKKADGYIMNQMTHDSFVKLRQGIGRLFRNEKSYGDIYILDPRAVRHKHYFESIFSIIIH